MKWLMLVLLAAWSCAPESDVKGLYQADFNGTIISLNLKERGKGSWEINDDSIPLVWERKGQLLMFHMKHGGLVQAKIAAKQISLQLPGQNVVLRLTR